MPETWPTIQPWQATPQGAFKFGDSPLTSDEVYQRLLANRQRSAAPPMPGAVADPIDEIMQRINQEISAGPGSEAMFTSSDPRHPSNRWQSSMPAMTQAYGARLGALGNAMEAAIRRQQGQADVGLRGLLGGLEHQRGMRAIDESGRAHSPQANLFQLNQGLLAAGLGQGRQIEDVLQEIQRNAPGLQTLVGRGTPQGAPLDSDRERIRIANDLGIPPDRLIQIGGPPVPQRQGLAPAASVRDILQRVYRQPGAQPNAPPPDPEVFLAAARSQLGPRWREALPDVISFMQENYRSGPGAFMNWWGAEQGLFPSSADEARRQLAQDIVNLVPGSIQRRFPWHGPIIGGRFNTPLPPDIVEQLQRANERRRTPLPR